MIKEGKTRQFWLDNEFIKTKGNRLFVPRGGDIRRDLIRECHDTLWAGHPGQERTLALIKQGYYWPQMEDDVTTYVKTCLTCQQDKIERRRPAGLLEPLPIPNRPWESVSLDFISGLPKVGDLTSILVVIDRFSKYATFIPVPKLVSAEETAQLFFKFVVKYWGIPQSIISDRDSRFTGNFWTELFKILGSKLCMTSSYHPQSDGQTERYNAMLEEYLRHFANASQKNWVKLLDVAQLCFNAQKNSGTGKSAIEIVTGQQPALPHTVDSVQVGKSPRAHNFSREWERNIELARSYLEKAAYRMKKHADQKRRPREFQVGDQVMVKLLPQERRFLRGRDHRLLQKYEGPLRIVKKIGKVAYRVDPPGWWKIHPVFHVSMLKPYFADTTDPSRGKSNRPGLKQRPKEKNIVEAILGDRIVKASRKQHQQFLVKWAGKDSEENTWENASDLTAFQELINGYLNKLTRASTALVGEDVTGCLSAAPMTNCTLPTPCTRPCAARSNEDKPTTRTSARALQGNEDNTTTSTSTRTKKEF